MQAIRSFVKGNIKIEIINMVSDKVKLYEHIKDTIDKTIKLFGINKTVIVSDEMVDVKREKIDSEKKNILKDSDSLLFLLEELQNIYKPIEEIKNERSVSDYYYKNETKIKGLCTLIEHIYKRIDEKLDSFVLSWTENNKSIGFGCNNIKTVDALSTYILIKKQLRNYLNQYCESNSF